MSTNRIVLRLFVAGLLCSSLPHKALAQGARTVGDVVLDSGVTLQDWLQLPTIKNTSDPLGTGAEAARFVRRYGPYRELLELVHQAANDSSLSANSVTRENATAKLAEIRSARSALGDWPALLMSSAIARGLAGDSKGALSDMKGWLRTVPPAEPGRADVVALLLAAETDPRAIENFVTKREAANQAKKRAGPRPTLPIPIDAAVWNALEQSEAYINRVPARAMTINMVRKEVKSARAETSESLIKEMRMVIPVGERCALIRANQTGTLTSNGASYSRQNDTHQCAGVPLIEKKGESTRVVTTLTKVAGSLFPPAIGAQENVEYETAIYPGNLQRTLVSQKCVVTARVEIGRADPRLTGNAWKLDCTYSSTSVDGSSKPASATYPDLLLEDLGMKLTDMSGASVNGDGTMPTAGYRVVDTSPSTATEMKGVSTVESFTWTGAGR